MTPSSDVPSGRRRLLGLLAALVLAVLAASVAPADWPGRSARLVVASEGSRWETPVALDGTSEVVLGPWEGRLVAGEALQVTLRSDRPATLDSVRVSLVLEDGREALIPLVRAEGTSLTAQRRPPRRAGRALGLLAVLVVLWLTEIVPLWVTSLGVPVALGALGIATASGALAPFFHPVIALFLAGFALAEAMERAGLDRRLALGLVARLGGGPVRLYAALLGTSAVASMFMSNTAAAALLVPLAVTLTAPLGEGARGYRKALVLGIAYAATLGGVGSAIGTPANPLAIAFLESTGRKVGFVGWFAYGLPMVVTFLPVVGTWVWWRLRARPPRELFEQAVAEAQAGRAALAAPSREELQVGLVFLCVVVGWLTDVVHGLHAGLVGLAGVVALSVLGRFGKAELAKIDWSALLTFGGGLSMGLHLTDSGASDWIATRLEDLATLPPAVGVAAIATLALALTSVASNTASAAILLPLAVPLASVVGVDPTQLVMVVAVASSIDFALVIGTPPTMVAYSTGELGSGEIFRIGVWLDLLGLGILLTVVVALWRGFGLIG